jgi:hypothetical protein
MPFAQIPPTDKKLRYQNEIWVLVASPTESMSASHPLRPNAARTRNDAMGQKPTY